MTADRKRIEASVRLKQQSVSGDKTVNLGLWIDVRRTSRSCCWRYTESGNSADEQQGKADPGSEHLDGSVNIKPTTHPTSTRCLPQKLQLKVTWSKL